MPIDNISVLMHAAAAYTKVNNQPNVDIDNTIRGSVDFQKMVNIEFNRFSNMTPDQILMHINSLKSGGSITSSVYAGGHNGIAETMLSDTRKKLHAHDTIAAKSLIHESSLVDLITSTAEAKNTLQTMVTVRDKFFEAWEKVLNMQI